MRILNEKFNLTFLIFIDLFELYFLQIVFYLFVNIYLSVFILIFYKINYLHNKILVSELSFIQILSK